MKLKRGLCIFLTLIMITACTACGQENAEEIYDFRFGKWGDSIEEIKKRDKEIDSFYVDDWVDEDWKDSIGGYTTFYDCDTEFNYHFKDGELISGYYNIKPTLTDTESVAELCAKILIGLEKEYGEMSDDEIDAIVNDDSEGPSLGISHSFKSETSSIRFFILKGIDWLGLEPHISITWSRGNYSEEVGNELITD